MTFYIDKNFARKHFSSGCLFSLLLGILLIIFSFVFYVETLLTMILIFIGCILIGVSLITFDLGSYGNLTFLENGFMIGRKASDSSDVLIVSEVLCYSYEIKSLSSITINKRFINLKGNFTKLKVSNKNSYGKDKLYSKKKVIYNVKIPRIYDKENELLEHLKNIGGIK